jgi:hypothetical protein
MRAKAPACKSKTRASTCVTRDKSPPNCIESTMLQWTMQLDYRLLVAILGRVGEDCSRCARVWPRQTSDQPAVCRLRGTKSRLGTTALRRWPSVAAANCQKVTQMFTSVAHRWRARSSSLQRPFLMGRLSPERSWVVTGNTASAIGALSATFRIVGRHPRPAQRQSAGRLSVIPQDAWSKAIPIKRVRHRESRCNPYTAAHPSAAATIRTFSAFGRRPAAQESG